MKKTICVLGAGLGGGIVAASLAARGHQVTLVEQGDVPAALHPIDEVWDAARIQAPFTRGSGLGGTSNFWHGGLTVLDRTDVEGIPDGEQRIRIPISYDQLRSYYAKALEILREGRAFSLTDIEKRPAVSMGDFGNVQGVFKPKALLYPSRPFSTGPLIQRSRNLHGLQLVSGFQVKRLVNGGNGTVQYAEGVDLKSGELRKFSADIFVLSAGGLGSPKILLNSTSGWNALERLPIGKFITDHPTGFVFKAKLRRRMDLRPLFGIGSSGNKLRYGFALNAGHLGAADYRNHILYLRPALSMKDPGAYDFLKRKLVTYRGRSLTPLDMINLVRHSDLLFDAINFRYGLSYSTRYVSGLVFAEQLPNPGMGMRRLGDGKFAISWAVSDEDRRSLEKFLALFFRDYSALFESYSILPNLNSRLDSAGHHSGGCRMASDASQGVVDGDLRVFGTDNLYVSDGSVLAYSGHANTGLSIAALALKCSEAIGEYQ